MYRQRGGLAGGGAAAAVGGEGRGEQPCPGSHPLIPGLLLRPDHGHQSLHTSSCGIEEI